MNIEEVVEKLEVNKLAIAAANDNFPPTKSTNPDSNEDGIKQSFIDALYSEQKDINSKIDDYKNLITERIQESKKSIEIGAKAAKNFSHAASALKTQKLNDLKRLKDILKIKKNDLEMFKNDHQLERSASYPQSMTKIWGILGVLLAVETALNGNILAQKAAGGYAEGLGLALIIAAINVIPAFMVGKFIYIHIWHISKFRKIACTFLSIIWFFLFSIGWNLFVAHTRSHMDLGASLGENITGNQKFFSDPPVSLFDISGMDSWTLLFVGFIFSIIALIDGVNSDDHYFGYGKVDKQVKAVEEDIKEDINELTVELDKLKKTYEKDVDSNEQTVKAAKNTIAKYHASRDMLIRIFENDVDSVKGQAKIQIKNYRQINAQKREDEPPKFFKKEPVALSFKKIVFKKIDTDESELDPNNTFSDAKLSIAKEFDQLNSEIIEKIS
jgi:hypothetical protein